MRFSQLIRSENGRENVVQCTDINAELFYGKQESEVIQVEDSVVIFLSEKYRSCKIYHTTNLLYQYILQDRYVMMSTKKKRILQNVRILQFS